MPKLNYSNITTSTEFATAAANIRQRGKTLRADVQKVLLCGLAHMDRCGDYTSSVLPILDAVKDAMGKNLHVAAVEWVLAFSWLTSTDGKSFEKDKAKVMNIADAAKVDWWTMEKPAKTVMFDLQTAVTKLFEKIDAEIKAERLNAETVQSTFLAKLDNPDLALDLFDAMTVDGKNAHLAMLVARMAPAVEVGEEKEAAAA